MIRVKLSTPNPDFPLIRQTPNSGGTWGNCTYYINQNIEECDYWIVYDSINNTEKVRCPKENVILITGEPPSVKKYSNSFIRQFHTIITCHKDIKLGNVIYRQQGLPWMAGARYLKEDKKWDDKNFMCYNDFLSMDSSKKNKEISIILSNKTFTEGHEQRIRFLNKIRDTYGEKIEVFGRGFNEIEDKIDGLANFKYSIVLENSVYRDYWTEKLADAFLCESYPIYYGCPNIHDYFPKGSLTQIDIFNVDEAANIIKLVMESDEYGKSLDSIKKSKELVLDQFNLFSLIGNVIANLEKTRVVPNKPESVKIYPEKRFRKKLRRIVKRLLIYKLD